MSEYEVSRPAPNNAKKVAWAGLSFTLLFTGFIAAQNAATTVYTSLKFEGLGEKCVLVIYLGLALGSVVASYFKQFLSHRAGFVIGAVGYGSIVIAGLITSTCDGNIPLNEREGYCSQTGATILNMIFSAICGIGASIIWLTQSDYVNTASTEETKGSYNSIFWGLMQLCQITSSLTMTFFLKKGSETTFYIILTVPVIISLIMFALTPIVEKAAETSAVELESLGSVVGKFGRAFISKKSLFLTPGMILIGIAIGFYANFLGRVNEEIAKEDNSDPLNSVGLIFILLAAGEIGAGALVGRLADKFNKIKVFHAMILIPELGLIMTSIAYAALSYPILVGSGFFWGFTDTALNSIVGVIIGSFFGGALEYFCLMRFLTGMGAVAGSSLALIMNQPSDIWAFTIITAVCLLGLHALFFFNRDESIDTKKSDVHEPLTDTTDI